MRTGFFYKFGSNKNRDITDVVFSDLSHDNFWFMNDNIKNDWRKIFCY